MGKSYRDQKDRGDKVDRMRNRDQERRNKRVIRQVHIENQIERSK